MLKPFFYVKRCKIKTSFYVSDALSSFEALIFSETSEPFTPPHLSTGIGKVGCVSRVAPFSQQC